MELQDKHLEDIDHLFRVAVDRFESKKAWWLLYGGMLTEGQYSYIQSLMEQVKMTDREEDRINAILLNCSFDNAGKIIESLMEVLKEQVSDPAKQFNLHYSYRPIEVLKFMRA